MPNQTYAGLYCEAMWYLLKYPTEALFNQNKINVIIFICFRTSACVHNTPVFDWVCLVCEVLMLKEGECTDW